MTWQHLTFMFFVGQLLVLLLGYCIGIQYQRQSLPQWLRDICKGIAAAALVIDVVANLTVLSFYFWEFPEMRDRHEWTFSTRLERLWSDTTWRGCIARPIALMLNFVDPLHCHIKAAVSRRELNA